MGDYYFNGLGLPGHGFPLIFGLIKPLISGEVTFWFHCSLGPRSFCSPSGWVSQTLEVIFSGFKCLKGKFLGVGSTNVGFLRGVFKGRG